MRRQRFQPTFKSISAWIFTLVYFRSLYSSIDINSIPKTITPHWLTKIINSKLNLKIPLTDNAKLCAWLSFWKRNFVAKTKNFQKLVCKWASTSCWLDSNNVFACDIKVILKPINWLEALHNSKRLLYRFGPWKKHLPRKKGIINMNTDYLYPHGMM